MITFINQSTDPYYNLAFEEYIFRTVREEDVFLVWQNSPCVVAGSGQNLCREVRPALLRRLGIPMLRRVSGGGTVYHDLGNVNYSLITAQEGPTDYEKSLAPIVAALNRTGVPASRRGVCDLAVGEKKISGSAQRSADGRLLHHGTLLFDTDPDMVAGALRADPEKFRSKSSKSVRSRVGNIRDFLREDMDLPAFWAYLKTALAGEGFVTGALSPEELEAVEALKRSRYDAWEWNFGRSPAYDMVNKRRWDGGSLEARVSVKEGRITGAAFRGDFLSRCSLEPLEKELEGVLFRREDIAAVLERYPLRDCFGAITGEEILDTMFYGQDETEAACD